MKRITFLSIVTILLAGCGTSSSTVVPTPTLPPTETPSALPEQPIITGSGGVEVWTFRAVDPGDTTIALGYYPPSDDNDPQETVTFSIRVE